MARASAAPADAVASAGTCVSTVAVLAVRQLAPGPALRPRGQRLINRDDVAPPATDQLPAGTASLVQVLQQLDLVALGVAVVGHH